MAKTKMNAQIWLKIAKRSKLITKIDKKRVFLNAGVIKKYPNN